MTYQPPKRLEFNSDEDEGTLIVPEGRLLIKYKKNKQRKSISNDSNFPKPASQNQIEKLNRRTAKINRNGEVLSRIQKDFLNILKQMPIMNDPTSRRSLLPKDQLRPSWNYGDNKNNDLESIVEQLNTPDILYAAIAKTVAMSTDSDEQDKLDIIRKELKKLEESEKKRSKPINDQSSINNQSLRNELNSSFNEQELKNLCFDLRSSCKDCKELNYEDLPALGLSGKITELILFFERRKILHVLIDKCKELRPNRDWDFDSNSHTDL